jgi:ribonuclease HI
VPGFDLINLKELVMITCWYMWWLRRRRARAEEVTPLNRCKMSILAITANAAVITKKNRASYVKWEKPKPREVKLNVDASFVQDLHAGAIGAVLRDYKGNFIAASSNYLPHVSLVSMAEAYATKEGLRLACERGCNNIVAESDSMETIESCTRVHQWSSDATAVYADCVDLVVSIGEVSFRHCLREANMVAHSLAHECFKVRLDCNWVDEPPSFILQPLLNDVTVM